MIKAETSAPENCPLTVAPASTVSVTPLVIYTIPDKKLLSFANKVVSLVILPDKVTVFAVGLVLPEPPPLIITICFSPSDSTFLQPVTAKKANDKINRCFIVFCI